MNSRKPKILTIVLTALFLAMFGVSLYYLALYPINKGSAVQQQAKEKYKSAYDLVNSVFGPYGISVYSYEEYEDLQIVGRVAEEEYYLSQLQPVVQPDLHYHMLLQEKDLGPIIDQSEAIKDIVFPEGLPAVQYYAPEDYIDRQVQYYDFVLKHDRLTPYYTRMKDKRRNDMPIVRLIVSNGLVTRALVILQHKPQGEGEGCSYWGAGTPGEDIINSIVAIYDSKPEIFRDYEPPKEPAEPEPEETETMTPTIGPEITEGNDATAEPNPEETDTGEIASPDATASPEGSPSTSATASPAATE